MLRELLGQTNGAQSVDPNSSSFAQVTGPREPAPAPVATGEWPAFELPEATKAAEAGPAFMRVTWQTANVTLSATRFAGDTALRWEMDVREDYTNEFSTFQYPAQPSVNEALLPKGYGQRAKADRIAPVVPSEKPVISLVPKTSITAAPPEYWRRFD